MSFNGCSFFIIPERNRRKFRIKDTLFHLIPAPFLMVANPVQQFPLVFYRIVFFVFQDRTASKTNAPIVKKTPCTCNTVEHLVVYCPQKLIRRLTLHCTFAGQCGGTFWLHMCHTNCSVGRMVLARCRGAPRWDLFCCPSTFCCRCAVYNQRLAAPTVFATQIVTRLHARGSWPFSSQNSFVAVSSQFLSHRYSGRHKDYTKKTFFLRIDKHIT